MAITRVEPVRVQVRTDWLTGRPREIHWGSRCSPSRTSRRSVARRPPIPSRSVRPRRSRSTRPERAGVDVPTPRPPVDRGRRGQARAARRLRAASDFAAAASLRQAGGAERAARSRVARPRVSRAPEPRSSRFLHASRRPCPPGRRLLRARGERHRYDARSGPGHARTTALRPCAVQGRLLQSPDGKRGTAFRIPDARSLCRPAGVVGADPGWRERGGRHGGPCGRPRGHGRGSLR